MASKIINQFNKFCNFNTYLLNRDKNEKLLNNITKMNQMFFYVNENEKEKKNGCNFVKNMHYNNKFINCKKW